MSEEIVLEISLTLKERKINIGGVLHTVKEMTGTKRDKWMKDMSDRMKTDATGKAVGVKNFDGLHASLIALCLFDADDKPVPEKSIKEWPASAQTAVFEVCQEINGLGGDENEEAVKND